MGFKLIATDYDKPKTTFEEDFSWQRPWIRKMRIILGPLVLQEAPLEEDCTRATDLLVLKADGLRIACRIRKPGYERFYDDFTITCRRESGAKCEWHKMILEGFADWFFYGHATHESPDIKGADILPRVLVNLPLARIWLRENHGPELGPNRGKDGKRCWFYAFNIWQLQREVKGAVMRTHFPEGYPCT